MRKSPRARDCFINRLGGEAGCRRLSQNFYARVAANGELKPLFPGKSLRCATEEFAAFLIQFLDGDEDHTQYRWWLSLRESHARFQISEQQRDIWLRLMGETVRAVVENVETQQSLEQFFGVTSDYILGREPGIIGHDELEKRWRRQRALDQVIDDIKGGRDAEAIDLTRQFTSQPSVFVGILARMMDADREPLADFVLEQIQENENLADRRFNGRTLLHFAAGSSCLPVVRRLLGFGVDPDILDNGRHAPLYRVAGKQGPMIVRELVRAGASVDHCGGVNKSTALHEAARHGNLKIAEALLEAGASQSAKDKNGLTPLDRAVNCRRPEVAALLSSWQKML